MDTTYWTYYLEDGNRENCEFDTMDEAKECAQSVFVEECEGDLSTCQREVTFLEFYYHYESGEPVAVSTQKAMVYSDGHAASQLEEHGILHIGRGGK